MARFNRPCSVRKEKHGYEVAYIHQSSNLLFELVPNLRCNGPRNIVGFTQNPESSIYSTSNTVPCSNYRKFRRILRRLKRAGHTNIVLTLRSMFYLDGFPEDCLDITMVVK